MFALRKTIAGNKFSVSSIFDDERTFLAFGTATENVLCEITSRESTAADERSELALFSDLDTVITSRALAKLTYRFTLFTVIPNLYWRNVSL